MKKLTNEFRDFLREYKIVSLAIAFVMGAASTGLVNSLVKDVIMPILEPLMATESWKEAVLEIGPINVAYGSFLAELINFLILAFIVFIFVRKIFKFEGEIKK